MNIHRIFNEGKFGAKTSQFLAPYFILRSVRCLYTFKLIYLILLQQFLVVMLEADSGKYKLRDKLFGGAFVNFSIDVIFRYRVQVNTECFSCISAGISTYSILVNSDNKISKARISISHRKNNH